MAILPKPYHALAQLFDGAEPIPLEAVRNVIHEELGMWPEELFASFDPEPIGSAVRLSSAHSLVRGTHYLLHS